MVSKETKWLSWAERQFLSPMWYRYVDDGFALIQGAKSKVLAWLNRIDTEDRPLSITYEISDTRVSFLDIDISLGERFRTRGILDTSIFRKDIALMPYTDIKSNHPPWMKLNWIKCEVIRLIRLCSNKDDYIAQKLKFFHHLVDRGYNRRKIIPILNSVNYDERAKLLESNPNPNPNSNRVSNSTSTLILPWNRGVASLRLAQQVMLIGKQCGVGCDIRTGWMPASNLKHILAKL